jgi:hypothetical protein
MTQCESKVFFPDNPEQPPQFSDCPRGAVMSRKVPGTSEVLKLCAKCAKMGDEQGGKAKATGAR